ncbi:putative lipase [Thermoascus aurantiacus ATCC 26904]
MSPRWWLYLQALFWRLLMRIGMLVHDLAWPWPPRPSFTRSFTPLNPDGTPSSSSVKLYFYCPETYLSASSSGRKRFPVVVNFHGGGFTLGRATDDARWARMVLDEVGAVFVSVDYRLAPEHPFPAAVDDGVDALRYLAAHADELCLDVSRVVLTGFSAGGNLAVTVPLRWRDRMVEVEKAQPLLLSTTQPPQTTTTTKNLRIIGLFSWYPILDFILPRSHRRLTSPHPEKTLPAFLTTLFDDSYLPGHVDRSSPYASPALAPDEILASGLPEDIFLYTCEWDMLLKEGQHFVKRLQGLDDGDGGNGRKRRKKVRTKMIERAPHAWDKGAVNPFWGQGRVDVLYRGACREMRALIEEYECDGFGDEVGGGEDVV